MRRMGDNLLSREFSETALLRFVFLIIVNGLQGLKRSEVRRRDKPSAETRILSHRPVVVGVSYCVTIPAIMSGSTLSFPVKFRREASLWSHLARLVGQIFY